MRRCLLPQLVLERVVGIEFATAGVAVADNVGEIVFDDVLLRIGDAIHQQVRRAIHVVDCGAWSDAAGEFYVGIGFLIVARDNAIVLARINNGWIVDGKIEHLAVNLNVAHPNVGVADDRDARSSSGDSSREQWVRVVDGGKIRRPNIIT